MAPEVRRLADDAKAALAAGDMKRAFAALSALERLEPDNPEWPKGVAVVFRRFGQRAAEIEALERAARAYVKQKDLLKAILLVKQVLALEPTHAEARRWLASLHARAGASAPASPPKIPNPTTWVGRREAPLAELRLKDAIPGVAATGEPSVFVIPTEDHGEGRGRTDPPARSGPSAPAYLHPKGAIAIDDDGNVRIPPPSGPAEPSTEVEDLALDMVAREVRSAERVQSVLPATPLFAALSPGGFDTLVDHARLVEHAKDAEIFHQGDAGEALYVIAEGQVGIVDEGPPRRAVARLGEGDVFGEVAIVTRRPRSASAVALTDLVLIAIDRQAIHDLVAREPAVLPRLLAFIKGRMVDRLFATNPLLAVLSPRDREALKAQCRLLEVESGGAAIRQGKQPSGLLLVVAGELAVRRAEAAQDVELARLGPGDVAGEMSLLGADGAIASVIAVDKAILIELPREHFLKILDARPEARTFIDAVVAERRAAAGQILGGARRYAEGRVRVT